MKPADVLRLIREQTAEKVRRAEFRERMTPEQMRRAEANLDRFDRAMGAMESAISRAVLGNASEAVIKLRDTITGAERTLTEESHDPEVTAWKWTEGTHGCDCERLSGFYPEPHDFPCHVRIEDDGSVSCVQTDDPGAFLIEVVSVTVDGVEVVHHNEVVT